MMSRSLCLVQLLLMALLPLIACASAPSAGGAQSSAPQRVEQKRVVAAIRSEPGTLYTKVLTNPGGLQGLDELELLVDSGLAVEDKQGELRPVLADAMPTIENGQWRVFPDGRMEMTWRIREGARWHDGTPFTSADLVFTATLLLDRDMPTFNTSYYRPLDGVEAVDDRTILVRWSRPFVRADHIFTSPLAPPVPKHLLEEAYLTRKAAFTDLPFWSSEFIGTGPYKLREFVPGSRVILDAHDTYVLGRPKLDVLEVRFLQESNALSANIVAGEVELTIGRTISTEQALQIRDRWPRGHMDIAPGTLYRISPQLLNPTPAVISNLQFRRALTHALDRQQIVESIQAGLVDVAHSFLTDLPEYREVNANGVRYDHDPRRAAELIELLGYTRDSEGFFRDPAGTRLTVELRTTAGDDTREKMLLSMSDYWQRSGVAVEQVLVPGQRNQDREYRANRPGFVFSGGGSYLDGLEDLHGSQSPLPETNYVGRNDSRYVNPEFDALLDRYVATIPKQERMQVVARIVEHIAENLNIITLFPQAEPVMVANRVLNVVGHGPNSPQSWNAHEWDLAR